MSFVREVQARRTKRKNVLPISADLDVRLPREVAGLRELCFEISLSVACETSFSRSVSFGFVGSKASAEAGKRLWFGSLSFVLRSATIAS